MIRTKPKSRGFTLIELVISMFIAVMVIGLVTVAITNIRRADLKAASGMMAGAMRYLYSLAVMLSQSIAPNVITYNAAFSACGLASALRLLAVKRTGVPW